MRVGVLGTGTAGRTLAAAIAATGDDVGVGTREVAALVTRDDGFAQWRTQHPGIAVGVFADVAASAEVLVNATAGTASLQALDMAGHAAFDGKILIDAANPLDFSGGWPPVLSVCNTDSLGEQIQRALPRTRVVKALNTVNADIMVNPGALAGGRHDLFVCGDDSAAKAEVQRLLGRWFGWQSFVDLGDITASRAMEMYLPLWLRLMEAVDSPRFSIRVVEEDGHETAVD